MTRRGQWINCYIVITSHGLFKPFVENCLSFIPFQFLWAPKLRVLRSAVQFIRLLYQKTLSEVFECISSIFPVFNRLQAQFTFQTGKSVYYGMVKSGVPSIRLKRSKTVRVTWHQVLITSKSIVSCEYLFPMRRERGKNSMPWLFRLTYEIRANRGFNFKRDRAWTDLWTFAKLELLKNSRLNGLTRLEWARESFKVMDSAMMFGRGGGKSGLTRKLALFIWRDSEPWTRRYVCARQFDITWTG